MPSSRNEPYMKRFLLILTAAVMLEVAEPLRAGPVEDAQALRHSHAYVPENVLT
jgi:hypothetical protein